MDRDMSHSQGERVAKSATERKREQRLRQAMCAMRNVQVTLSAEEYQLLMALREKQRGPVDGFVKRALLVGAKFLANAGTARGQKVKGGVL